MTVNQAAQLCVDINQWKGWHAWPARSNSGQVPLVWFTRIDGSTRVFHAFTCVDFHKIRIKIEGGK